MGSNKKDDLDLFYVCSKKTCMFRCQFGIHQSSGAVFVETITDFNIKMVASPIEDNAYIIGCMIRCFTCSHFKGHDNFVKRKVEGKRIGD